MEFWQLLRSCVFVALLYPQELLGPSMLRWKGMLGQNSETPFGGGSCGGGGPTKKSMNSEVGFILEIRCWCPISYLTTLNSSAMIFLLTVLASKTQGCPSRIYQFFPVPSWSVFLLVDSRTSLPQKVPAANHIHRNHQRVSHVLNRNVPFVSVAFSIK